MKFRSTGLKFLPDRAEDVDILQNNASFEAW